MNPKILFYETDVRNQETNWIEIVTCRRLFEIGDLSNSFCNFLLVKWNQMFVKKWDLKKTMLHRKFAQLHVFRSMVLTQVINTVLNFPTFRIQMSKLVEIITGSLSKAIEGPSLTDNVNGPVTAKKCCKFLFDSFRF